MSFLLRNNRRNNDVGNMSRVQTAVSAPQSKIIPRQKASSGMMINQSRQPVQHNSSSSSQSQILLQRSTNAAQTKQRFNLQKQQHGTSQTAPEARQAKYQNPAMEAQKQQQQQQQKVSASMAEGTRGRITARNAENTNLILF